MRDIWYVYRLYSFARFRALLPLDILPIWKFQRKITIIRNVFFIFRWYIKQYLNFFFA